jgi:adenine-specific DNA-methyltransferase
MRQFFENGTARIARGKRGPSILYMQSGVIARIESGTYKVVGRGDDGSLQLDWGDTAEGRRDYPRTAWNSVSHSATSGGTRLLARLVPDRSFPYPKSLYAVEDTLRYAVGHKPDAVILDFFAGSGTTAHAVARLNKQDAGRRQSISVTNNEVSPAEATALTEQGFRDGDPEWEALGIFEHITRPRITAAVTGETPDREPIKGDYKFTDEFPMADGFEENVEFLELTYLDGERVELDLAFEAIAPLLWLRAGSGGPIVTETRDAAGRRLPYEFGATYAVLFNPDRWRSFLDRMGTEIRTVFIVTDSVTTFATVSAELPAGVEPVRLYRNYLSTFEINRRVGP